MVYSKIETNIEIRDIRKLLLHSIPLNTIIKKYTTNDLVEAGENNGGYLVSVTLIVEDSLKSISELQLVAKLLPKSEWMRKQFNVQVTFKREIAMYESIMPTLHEFQREQECTELVNYLPRLYGARINLNPESTVVDDNAVLLLENLKTSEFLSINRREGFNFDETQIILKTLAKFHALPVAFKIKKPQMFRRIILPHLSCLNLFSVSEDIDETMLDNICNIIISTEECIPLIENVRRAYNLPDSWKKKISQPKEPFATIIHNDLWVNNIMIKFVKDTPMECKLFDFQTMEYGSPCSDLVFFLYTSVKAEVLNQRFNYFRDYYFNVFTDTLESLKCDPTLFSYELFLQEFENAGKTELKHIILMLDPVLNLKRDRPADEASEDDLTSTVFDSEEYKKRIPEVVLDFFQKGWI